MIQNAREIFGVDLSPDNAALLDALGIMTPEQSERLVSDRSHDRAQPTQWDHDTVKRRLLDAAELIERTSRAAGPSRKMTSWVDWQLFRGVTDFERNAMAEGLTEGTRLPDRGVNRAAGAREIAAAEIAMQWPILYIADDGERRALALWIHCDLTGAPFGRLAHRVAGSRGTAYRRLDKALSRIVAGLQGDGAAPI
jgi:hypothetical protein